MRFRHDVPTPGSLTQCRTFPLPLGVVHRQDSYAADSWNDKLLLLSAIPSLKGSVIREHRVRALTGKGLGEGEAGMTHLKGQSRARESMNSAGGTSPRETLGRGSHRGRARQMRSSYSWATDSDLGEDRKNQAHLGPDRPKHSCRRLVS